MNRQKSVFKTIAVVLTLLMIMVMGASSVSAAAKKAPAPVKKVTAKQVTDTSIKVTWKKVSGAYGYEVYMKSLSTGKRSKVASTRGTSYTRKKLTTGKEYSFEVYSYKKSGKKKLLAATAPSASVKLTITKPSVPTKFKDLSYGDCSVTFKWTKGKNSSGTELWKLNSSTGEYVRCKTTTDNSISVGGLKDGASYAFKIRSYRKKNGLVSYSGFTAPITVTAHSISAEVKGIHTAYYATKLKKSTVVKVGNVNKTLSAGTRIYTTASPLSGKTVNGYLENGTRISIKGSLLKLTGLQTSKTDYTKAVKESFVNSKGYSSGTKYLIWISQYKLKVNVFTGSKGKWKLVKTFPCCIGKATTRTPRGVKRLVYIEAHGKFGPPHMWFTRHFDKAAGEYVGNSFHIQVDSNMSKAVSHGCIRLRSGDLNWLYNHCKLNTTVVSL